MKRKRGLLLVVLAAIAIAVLGTLFARRGRGEAAEYRTETVQRGDLSVVVSATGTLNPVTKVLVGSQVSGTISALYADFNSHVKKDAIIAQLDPTFLRAQVAQSDADLERARVTERQAERDLSRLELLRAEGLTSQAEIDAAETTLDGARASAKGAVAALERAQTNLRYATIRSPIDGIVISRDVDVGQTVAASMSAPTLFTIANDLSRMQLEASVDEADIGRITVGQIAGFTVDAFPDRKFTGVVDQIRLAPHTEQNVVSYTVIIRVENPGAELLPGMTANVTFVVSEASDVLKVPSAALRFRPRSGGTENSADAFGGASGRERPAGAGNRERGESSSQFGDRAATGAGRPAANGASDRGAVYVMESPGRLRRVEVRSGITDGVLTAVYSDSLSAGDRVVTAHSQAGVTPAQGTVNPFMPGGTRRDRR